MTLGEKLNSELSKFAAAVAEDITSSNISGTTSFEKTAGIYVNSPLDPWTSGVIPLNKSNSIKGGIVSIWYKGPVLNKSSFTGGVVTMFSGSNTLNELCRVFIDYDLHSGAFCVNIQTGFTGDIPDEGDCIPTPGETAPVITIEANTIIKVITAPVKEGDTVSGYNVYSSVDGLLDVITVAEAMSGYVISLSDNASHNVTVKSIWVISEESLLSSNVVNVDLTGGSENPSTPIITAIEPIGGDSGNPNTPIITEIEGADSTNPATPIIIEISVI